MDVIVPVSRLAVTSWTNPNRFPSVMFITSLCLKSNPFEFIKITPLCKKDNYIY